MRSREGGEAKKRSAYVARSARPALDKNGPIANPTVLRLDVRNDHAEPGLKSVPIAIKMSASEKSLSSALSGRRHTRNAATASKNPMPTNRTYQFQRFAIQNGRSETQRSMKIVSVFCLWARNTGMLYRSPTKR
jgi:hypothetical protein